MSDRFFPNDLPSFVDEASGGVVGGGGGGGGGDSLVNLLSLPYSQAADQFLRAGLDLKDRVFYLKTLCYLPLLVLFLPMTGFLAQIAKETWTRVGRRVMD